MASIEERMQTLERGYRTLEQEHIELKKTVDLYATVIGALVNKATLEMLEEKYDKIFDALIAHDRLTNDQLSEMRTQQIEEDGKVVGLQTEMRQRFAEQDGKIAALDSKIAALDGKVAALDGTVVGLQNEMHHRFTGIETALAQILKRLPERP